MPKEKPSYVFGAFLLDVAEHRLLRDGQPVPLTPKALDLLQVLVENAGRLVEKEELLKQVWRDSFVEESNINRNISILRKALDGDGTGQPYIETVPKRGYRFVAPVREQRVEPIESDGLDEKTADGVPPSGSTPTQRVRYGAVFASLLGFLALLTALLIRGGAPASGRPLFTSPVHAQITFTGNAGHAAISPDGSRIAYVLFESTGRHKYEAGMRVMVRDRAAGTPVELFRADRFAAQLRWSPDGASVLFRAASGRSTGIYIAPQNGGQTRLIAPGAWMGCWSPDGSQLATARQVSRTITFVSATTGEATRSISLETSFQWLVDIDWSPTGEFLLFVTEDDKAHSAVGIIRADGTGERQLLDDAQAVTSARWSPQGDAVYYFRKNGQVTDLWKLPLVSRDRNVAGSPTVVLAGLESDRFFAMSADARRLVYSRAPEHSNLWIGELSGANAKATLRTRQLTTGTARVQKPAISPDKKWVAYSVGAPPTANLFVVPVEGGPPRQLTFLGGQNVEPAWSADGRQLAFISTSGGEPSVWVANADGTAPQPLLHGQLSTSFVDLHRTLVWGPGSQILVSAAGNRNFHVLDAVTAATRHLVADDERGWMFDPAYSTDGARVAIFWNRPSSRGIWVLSLADSRKSFIRETDQALPVSWSPDGRSVYVMENQKILAVPLTGEEPQLVAPLPADGIGTVSIAPDGRTLVWSVHESRSDVWLVEDIEPQRPTR